MKGFEWKSLMALATIIEASITMVWKQRLNIKVGLENLKYLLRVEYALIRKVHELKQNIFQSIHLKVVPMMLI